MSPTMDQMLVARTNRIAVATLTINRILPMLVYLIVSQQLEISFWRKRLNNELGQAKGNLESGPPTMAKDSMISADMTNHLDITAEA